MNFELSLVAAVEQTGDCQRRMRWFAMTVMGRVGDGVLRTEHNTCRPVGESSAPLTLSSPQAQAPQAHVEKNVSFAEQRSSLAVSPSAPAFSAAAVSALPPCDVGSPSYQRGYTVKVAPYHAGTYHSRKAIDLYHSNQKLSSPLDPRVEFMPRINENV